MRSAWILGAVLAGGIATAAVGCGSDEGSGFPDDGGTSGASGGASGTSGASNGGIGASGGQGDSGASGGTSNGGPTCATARATAAREPVYLDIVLDRSRSMDGHGNVAGNTCDTRQDPGDDSTCFLANAREPDPLAPERTIDICHQYEDPSQCPDFVGLTGKKWLAARGALVSFFDAAQAAADPRVAIGMFLFDGRTENDSEWMVEPGVVDAARGDQLRATVLPPEFATQGGTPLRAAITSQSALLRAFVPTAPLEAGGKRVLVIMTDGTPGDCGPGRNTCVDDVAALAAGEPSIATFVIGIGAVDAEEGSVYDEKFLSRLAAAGGAAEEGCNPAWDGQNPAGTTPCHFQVTPGERTAAQIEADMRAAIFEIAARVQSCELTLEQTSAIDPAKVNVLYTAGNGTQSQVPADPANGWTYDNPQAPTKVILNGAACDQLKADTDASVEIVIGCPTGTSVVN